MQRLDSTECDSLKAFNNMAPSSPRKLVYTLEEIYDEVGGFGKA